MSDFYIYMIAAFVMGHLFGWIMKTNQIHKMDKIMREENE